MKLKVYADRMSQPSRAVIIFCKVNGIDYEEVKVDISKRQHLTPEFSEINPMKEVPAIVHGKFKLFESHSYPSCFCLFWSCRSLDSNTSHAQILQGSLTTRPTNRVLDLIVIRYPTDIFERSKIHSVLDWHHSNLRRGAVTYVVNTTLAPAVGRQLDPQAAAEAEKLLSASLSKIDSIFLKDNESFLLGANRPSIADLSLVCEIMQLEVLDEKDRTRLLEPHWKV